MGDAGPPLGTSAPIKADEPEQLVSTAPGAIRDINVLVTGFGPFKTFLTNPSYLIASSLPDTLEYAAAHKLIDKRSSYPSRNPARPPNSKPYRIKIHAYPTPVKVTYETAAAVFPSLVAWKNSEEQGAANASPSAQVPNRTSRTCYDYVIHLGMAGGREDYYLETLAHRDHYKIKDEDNRDGFMSGEYLWKREGLPEVNEVGWDQEEVLSRWEILTHRLEDEWEKGEMQAMGWKSEGFVNREAQESSQESLKKMCLLGKGKRAVVKLSKDAGRFLCEFTLYASLAVRLQEAQNATENVAGAIVPNSTVSAQAASEEEPAGERKGKVAFLHVPGGVREHDIARGVRVTEAAILAFVTSWEDGYRNPDMYS